MTALPSVVLGEHANGCRDLGCEGCVEVDPEAFVRTLEGPELHLGDRVAIADGSIYQGERGRIVGLDDCSVDVRLGDGEVYRVAWWKDVQLVNDDAPA